MVQMLTLYDAHGRNSQLTQWLAAELAAAARWGAKHGAEGFTVSKSVLFAFRLVSDAQVSIAPHQKERRHTALEAPGNLW